MRALRSGPAEVIERFDDATFEVMTPDSIDDHASCQRVFRTRQPPGESKSSSRSCRALARFRKLESAGTGKQRGRHSGINRPARSEIVAPPQDVGW